MATTRSSPTPRPSPGSTSRTWSGAPARLDWAKLNHLNNHYIRLAETARLAELVAEVLTAPRRGRCTTATCDGWPARFPWSSDGAKTIAGAGRPVRIRPEAPSAGADAKTPKDLLTDETRARLARLRDALRRQADWDVAGLEAAEPQLRRERGRRPGQDRPGAARGAVAADRRRPTWPAPWPRSGETKAWAGSTMRFPGLSGYNAL